MRVLGTLAALGLVVAISGCYSPQIRDCVNTCEGSLVCPAGLECVQGFCRLPGATLACMQDDDASTIELDALPHDDGSQPDGGSQQDAVPRPDAACGLEEPNLCGGSCELFGAPGDACDSGDHDSCADDELACAGPEELTCVNMGTDWDLDLYSVGEDACGGDCNDSNALVFPGAPEVCNDVDDDCDGTTDEGGSACLGACPLLHVPGDACDSADDADECTDDVYVCDGLNAVTCQNAGTDDDFDGWSVCSADQGTGDCSDSDGQANPGVSDPCWDCNPSTCLEQGYLCQCGDPCECAM